MYTLFNGNARDEMMKKTMNLIYQALDDFKALTADELEHLLHMNFQTIINGLGLLISEKRIQSTNVQRNNPFSKYKFFKEYVGWRLYYIDNEHLLEWIRMQLPPLEKTSEGFQEELKKKVGKNFGINMEEKE
jgi:hypothetical protein